MRKHTTIPLSDDATRRAVASLRTFAAEQLDEELSDLKASLLLEHILADIAPAIYNKAVADARQYVEERAADLDAALQLAEFPRAGRKAR